LTRFLSSMPCFYGRLTVGASEGAFYVTPPIFPKLRTSVYLFYLPTIPGGFGQIFLSHSTRLRQFIDSPSSPWFPLVFSPKQPFHPSQSPSSYRAPHHQRHSQSHVPRRLPHKNSFVISECLALLKEVTKMVFPFPK